MKIHFEQTKKECGITLSALVSQDAEASKEIANIQKTLRQQLDFSGTFLCESAKGLSERVDNSPAKKVEKLVYQYPGERIHFSMINFLNPVFGKTFTEKSSEFKSALWFDELIYFIREQVVRQIPFPLSIKINSLYRKDGDILGSFAINAAMEMSLRKSLLNLEKLAQDRFKDKFKYKDFKPGHKTRVNDVDSVHVINLFRFLDDHKQSLEASLPLAAAIEKISANLEKNPIKLTIKNPVIVISDSYLSNDGYQLWPET